MNQLALTTQQDKYDLSCTDLMTLAEKELAAFFRAVAELFGPEQAKLAAEDWLRELPAIDSLPGSSREWRRMTIKVSARLAGRVNASPLSSPSQTLGHFVGVDGPVSSAQTQRQLGWRPKQPGLIADLDHERYFQTTPPLEEAA